MKIKSPFIFLLLVFFGAVPQAQRIKNQTTKNIAAAPGKIWSLKRQMAGIINTDGLPEQIFFQVRQSTSWKCGRL